MNSVVSNTKFYLHAGISIFSLQITKKDLEGHQSTNKK